MEFMTLSEVLENAADIRAEFEALLMHVAVVTRPKAGQWQFLKVCMERTLGQAPAIDPLATWRPEQILHYKFQVDFKLRKMYLSGGRPLAFTFRLVNVRDVQRNRFVLDKNYPSTGGYYLLVRERRNNATDVLTRKAQRELIEVTVTDCLHAEFAAYRALPSLDFKRLAQWMHPKGPAYKDITLILEGVRKRGWVLTNKNNPSSYRLISLHVKELEGESAIAKTTEYMYLRWWNTRTQKYEYPYRETNRHTYYLSRYGDKWLVDENIQPPPLSSAPHRR